MSLQPRYLLDTNICIDLMKHQPPKVAERFAACRIGAVLISAITAAELHYGVVASGAEAERNRAAGVMTTAGSAGPDRSPAPADHPGENG